MIDMKIFEELGKCNDACPDLDIIEQKFDKEWDKQVKRTLNESIIDDAREVLQSDDDDSKAEIDDTINVRTMMVSDAMEHAYKENYFAIMISGDVNEWINMLPVTSKEVFECDIDIDKCIGVESDDINSKYFLQNDAK